MAAYNDSRCADSRNFSGLSVSNDGGLTFTRVTNGSGCSPFANTFGDPVILYDKPSGTWFTVWLDGNAGCTLGGYKSTIPTTQIAGRISAFTQAAATTASLAGPITTPVLPSSGTCIFPGTTLIKPKQTSSFRAPLKWSYLEQRNHGEHAGYLYPQHADHR